MRDTPTDLKSLFTGLVGLFVLSGCASTAPLSAPLQAPAQIDPELRALFAIPDTLPGLDEPLGVLRPDAKPSRNDIKIRIDDYAVTEHKADTVLTGRNGIQAAIARRGWDYIARVDWRIRWDYDLDKKDGLCVVEDAETILTVTYALPDWKPSRTPEPGLQAYWDKFEDALWVHEYGHAKIGYDAKMSIQNALEKTTFEERNCQSLARKLNRMAREIIDREIDEAYDGVTDHGRTQGAYYDVRDARAAVRNYQRNEGQT